jgi:hypothetical protein
LPGSALVVRSYAERGLIDGTMHIIGRAVIIVLWHRLPAHRRHVVASHEEPLTSFVSTRGAKTPTFTERW